MIHNVTYSETDIIENRNEIIEVFNSMMDVNSSSSYQLFPLYKESFEKFCYEVIDIIKILKYQQQQEKFPVVPFIEEDKYLLIKTKNKQKTIVDIFCNYQTTSTTINNNNEKI